MQVPSAIHFHGFCACACMAIAQTEAQQMATCRLVATVFTVDQFVNKINRLDSSASGLVRLVECGQCYDRVNA